MLFTYDFAEKIDLSRFKKQAPHYIANMREVTYNLFLKDYKMVVEVATPDNCRGHIASLHLFQVKRDKEGEIIDETVIVPLLDTRFKELKCFQEIYKIDSYKAHFDSNSAAETINKICTLLKIINKINNLKVFL